VRGAIISKWVVPNQFNSRVGLVADADGMLQLYSQRIDASAWRVTRLFPFSQYCSAKRRACVAGGVSVRGGEKIHVFADEREAIACS
jgi:hypothetical protein